MFWVHGLGGIIVMQKTNTAREIGWARKREKGTRERRALRVPKEKECWWCWGQEGVEGLVLNGSVQ